MNWLTRLLCALRDHAGITDIRGYTGTCKRCRATVNLMPRKWRPGGPA